MTTILGLMIAVIVMIPVSIGYLALIGMTFVSIAVAPFFALASTLRTWWIQPHDRQDSNVMDFKQAS